MQRAKQTSELAEQWAHSPRWNNVQRDYSAADVVKLRGSVQIEHTLARLGAEKLWRLINQDEPLCALGALSGNQAIQAVQAGLKAIYCSGWQAAGDANSAGEMYPDQGLYPADTVPKLVERINNALLRTDEVHALDERTEIDWLAPIIADADAANLVSSDSDERDHPFMTGERTAEGYYRTRAGLDQAIDRSLAYAPYADVLWCETSRPDLKHAARFADAIHARFPNKLLAYNCSPSFNWQAQLDQKSIRSFREDLGRMGYKFQFIALAGWHSLNSGMFQLSRGYKADGMAAFTELQQQEYADEADGFRAAKHQSFVGAGYFDAVQNTILAGQSTVAAQREIKGGKQFAA